MCDFIDACVGFNRYSYPVTLGALACPSRKKQMPTFATKYASTLHSTFLLIPSSLVLWCFNINVFSPGSTFRSGPGFPYCRDSKITTRYTTGGRTPLDKWSANLTIHNTHNRQTPMPRARIKPTTLRKRLPADPRVSSRGNWYWLFNRYSPSKWQLL